jgi:hypothetical protein
MGDTHRPGAMRRAASQLASLADVASTLDRFDLEATLEDLAAEWVRVFAEAGKGDGG